MGTLHTPDAVVSGGLSVRNDTTTLLTNASITAGDHTAPITLARGGQALVCSTSEFHLLHSGTTTSLLFGLDRGAFQLQSASQPQDVILTPDIRFTIESPGLFDLRMRVTRDGDTCVDNRGAHAPVLLLYDAFSNAAYRLLPGQHVLFEHGDLHSVVDNEHSPCGCPEAAPTSQELAADATPAERAAAAHPFPAAASQGLANTPDLPPPTPTAGNVHSSTDFRINAGDSAPVALTTTAPSAVPPAQAASPAAPPPSPPGIHDIGHAIGHFFHRLFHPHKTTPAP